MITTILIGISSGIAAYKVESLITRLRGKKYKVIVVMTDHATCMVHPAVFEKASGNEVITSLFPKDFDVQKVLQRREVDHIRLADSASLVLIAPATANILAKIAHGIADDMLTTILLATRAPVLLCPSMNVKMWENEAVAENIKTLQKRGITILDPVSGDLACGYQGKGRLPEADYIEKEIEKILKAKTILQGKKVLITAGGTMEWLDPVRFITNRSSGKMGKAFAQVCKNMGADVILLRAQSAVSFPQVTEEFFETSHDLSLGIQKYMKHVDLVIHTAAVSDFVPQKKFAQKIDSGRPLTVRFTTTAKILHQMKSWNSHAIIVGFKAVYKENDKRILSTAKRKLRESQADFVIANDVGRDDIGFGADENEVYIVSRKKEIKIGKAHKSIIAQKAVEFIVQTLPEKFHS